jgi:PAS domain S-box-containing protein
MDNNSLTGSTILIVDDDLTVSKLFEVFLEMEGCRSIIANSGKNALEIVSLQKIDLILLDVMMPDMDGFEVCTELQSNPLTRNIPIIFVTAKDDNESFIKGFKLGAIDYLNKPINRLELTVKIRNYLTLSRNEARLRESELRYKSIVEDQTELIVRFLPDGTLSFVNKAFCAYVNKTQEELLRINLNNKHIPGPLSDILPEINSLNREFPVKTRKRKIFFTKERTSWLEWVDHALFDHNGTLIEFQCVGRDITIQKKYEEVIRLIADETSGTIGELFFNVLLINIEKILNLDYAILGRFSNIDDGTINTFSACRKSEIIDDFEFTFKNTKYKKRISRDVILCLRNSNVPVDEKIFIQGEEIRSFASVPLFDKNHSAIGVLVVFSKKPLQMPELVLDLLKIYSTRAATELERIISDSKIQESEKKFKNIFHSSVDGIVITNFDYEIIEANDSFRRIFELPEKGDEKMFFINYLHYSDLRKFESNFTELLNSGAINSPLEIRMVTSKGEIRIYEVISKVIEYQLGNSVLSILRDITERKEMHLQILNTIIDTEEKERKRFSQDLHDGLGPLLSTIKLYSKSILTAKNEENKEIAVERSIQTIDEAIASIKEIANNISPHILRNFGLVIAINSFVNKFGETNKENICFQHDLSKRLNPKIESALFRIVIELINNTFKHAYANNISISLDLYDGIIGLRYADDGIGCDLNSVMQKQTGNGISNIINRTKSLNGEININTNIDKGFFVQISINDQ